MNRFFFLLKLALFPAAILAQNQTVNPVLGDTSYIKAFGVSPDDGVSEKERIRTHFAYVEEKLLEADCSMFTEKQLHNREKVIGYLHRYSNRGIFPVNSLYTDERKPCFIDDAGTICAVGFLVQKTEGLAFAEAINKEYQYATIAEMKSQELSDWASKNGLTLQECAMIQPAYAFRAVRIRKTAFGISGGYTSSFARIEESVNGGSIQTAPGFEVGLVYRQYLGKGLTLFSGASYVSGNIRLSAGGSTFKQQYNRLCIPLTVGYLPVKKGPYWLRRTMIKLGAQAGVYATDLPGSRTDFTTGITDNVIEKNKLEWTATAEIIHNLLPVYRLGHAVSIVWNQGLQPVYSGTVSDASKTYFRYSNRGTYLGVKYIVYITSSYKRD